MHPRQPFGGRSVDYRHYIVELARKPQAVRQVADELIASLGEPFALTWRLLVDQHNSPKHAARVFAQVLAAIVDRGEHVVARELKAALARGETIQLAFRARALGQTAFGNIDVAETHVRVEVTLPWLFQKFAQVAQVAIRNRGNLLLTKRS